MSEYVVTEEIRTIDYTDFFSKKPGKRDIAVFIVTAPDGSVKEFNSDDFDFVLDARIAADSYADEHNLIHYRTTIAQQQAEIERLKGVANKALQIAEAYAPPVPSLDERISSIRSELSPKDGNDESA
jgi:hypothetical protein